MKDYGILRIEIDDQNNKVGFSLYPTVYNDLAVVRETIEYFMKKVKEDENPLQVGWQVVFKIVKLSTVLGETRQADYGSGL